jgi:2-polyprenyl-3-methyl-5-hydroxy-6-metoxy-1,4-benzoquinol methylase
MDPLAVQAMIAAENSHPWYRARLTFVQEALKFLSSSEASILDFGCGSGAALELCKKNGFKKSLGLDVSDYCVSATTARGIDARKVDPSVSSLNEVYDLIICLDVLEHLENDLEYLRIFKNHLNENGRILVSVPAHQLLWSHHDVVNHHYRRYSKGSFVSLVNQSQLRVVDIRYWNSMLFPFFIISRMLSKVLQVKDSNEFATPPKPIAVFLHFILKQEALHRFFGKLPGLSIIATLKK